jgi:hypothetical protein
VSKAKPLPLCKRFGEVQQWIVALQPYIPTFPMYPATGYDVGLTGPLGQAYCARVDPDSRARKPIWAYQALPGVLPGLKLAAQFMAIIVDWSVMDPHGGMVS